jgi:hypothetical protein
MNNDTIFIKPYKYELIGELGGSEISIMYTPMGAGAIPYLEIIDTDGTHNFRGKEISKDVVLGLTLVSVDMSKHLPGAPSKCLSLLVPDVNLLNQKDTSALVHTKCIQTIGVAASLPPMAHVGQVESYHIINLIGTASDGGPHPL